MDRDQHPVLRFDGATRWAAGLTPETVGRLDWLVLDVSEVVNSAADERGRAKIVRQMQRALAAESD